MAKGHSSKNDEGLGCLFAIFELIGSVLLLLFLSGDPMAKAVGWGIIGVIAFLCILASAGVSGESALLIIGAIVVVAVAFIVINALADDSGKGKKNTTAAKPGEVGNRSASVNRTTVGKPVKRETFEEQFNRMQKQVEVVCGKTIRMEREDVKVVVQRPEDKYYHSVEEALEHQNVPVGYKKIMIERILKTDIKECPGLIWKDDVMLSIFPLLRNSKVYSWSLTSIPIILYEKRINPDVDKEFLEVGQADIAVEFEALFPEYPFGQEGLYTGKFILPVGLEVTNTSGKVLFEMISAEFHVVDDITQSLWYAKEIKELYQKNVLRENGIISYEKYAEEKQKLLEDYKAREKDEAKIGQQLEAAKKLQLL